VLIRTQQEIADLGTEHLRLFQADLSLRSSPELYRDHIRNKPSCLLLPDGVERLYDLFVAEWGIEKKPLRLVGSSATGFSIKPKRRWNLFDFSSSDIDIAITDRDFFDDIWQEVHEYHAQTRFWRDLGRFKEHLFDGWIRPDVLPGELGRQWFDFFRHVQAMRVFGSVKVRAAMYPSDYYLEAYQCAGIEVCRKE
jgi:hypothetical protein